MNKTNKSNKSKNFKDDPVKAGKKEGFSLIESLVGIALVAVAIMGLVQLFTYSILNNARSERITRGTFLAQQQIEFIRNLPSIELANLLVGDVDELVDVNADGMNDFRRITRVQFSGSLYDVRVMVFPIARQGIAIGDLFTDPVQHRVLANMNTIISR
jgi:prepilin-type N-terminal cleavage/methylation domain-containing protein